MQKAAADPLIGSLLEGRYRIRAWLAVGGMSTVYAALDERLDREVAVKVMAPSLSTDPVFLDRFAREAQTAARLSHVNAVAVYDQGSDAGRVFLVMELVRGRTLRDLLRERGHVSPAEAVSLLEPMLAALASAHRAGLVHRDVKPENILLSDDGVVKVADFGLARAVTGDAGAANTGLIMGTVAYSAPEQFRRGNVDARSDVYSAGVVLFELLTGRQPHVGPDAMSVAYNHVHTDVPPPSSFQPGIAPALDQLVRRVTARDPGLRPYDAGAFLAELHDLRRELRLPILPVPRRARPSPETRTGQGAGQGPALPTSSASRPWYPPARDAAGGGGPSRAGTTAPHPSTTDAHRSRTAPHPSASAGPASGAPGSGWTSPVFAPVFAPGHDATTVYGAGGPRPASADGVHHTLVAPVDHDPPAHGATAAHGAAPPRRRRRRWLRTLVGALVLLLVCAGLVAGSWWYAAGRWSSVPNVHDQPVQQAQDMLQSRGFRVVTDRPQADDVVNRGNAIATRPETGTRLVHGRTVHILVSSGPTFYAVPTLHDKSKRAASTTLGVFTDRGVTVTYSETADDTVAKGDVVRTDPSAGTKVRRGDTITVYVSTGPPIVDLPDVTGQTFDEASTSLAKLGFTVARNDEFSDDVDSGTVISQEPDGSTQQRKFTAVTLTVSKGPDLVTVPELPHLDPLDDAEQRLTAAGLDWEIKNYLGGVNGLVLQMDHDPGEQLKRGSTVTLTII